MNAEYFLFCLEDTNIFGHKTSYDTRVADAQPASVWKISALAYHETCGITEK